MADRTPKVNEKRSGWFNKLNSKKSIRTLYIGSPLSEKAPLVTTSGDSGESTVPNVVVSLETKVNTHQKNMPSISDSTHSSILSASDRQSAGDVSPTYGLFPPAALNDVEALQNFEKRYKTLFSRETLLKALDDPVGLHKFGQFLASELGAEQLCFWLNAEQHSQDYQRLRSLSKRLHDLHIPAQATLALNITALERADLVYRISQFMATDDPYAVAREAALSSMHSDAWPRFVKLRMTLAHNAAIRGSRKGRVDSFCLSDASMATDQPVLMSSNGFQKLTGFSFKDTVGVNCRFLQGPGTSKNAVARIKKACALGLPSQELLLNYRADGRPFWNLLRIEPLRDHTGQLKYLLGHQFILNSATSDLSFLLSDELDEVSQQDTGNSVSGALVNFQQNQAQQAASQHISSQLQVTQKKMNPDRDQRLKDASALAFDATAMRPMSSASRSIPAATSNSSPSSTPAAIPTARFNRPTSAGGPGLAFGAASSREERRQISSLTQIGDLVEEDIFYQNQALARFCFVEPGTSKILFSSPSLPAEFAQGSNFFDIVAKHNGSAVMKKLGKAFGSNDHEAVEVKLRVAKDWEPTHPLPVTLSITPLLTQEDLAGGIMILFGL